MAFIGTFSRALLESATAVYYGGNPVTVLDALGNVVVGDTPPAPPTISGTIADRVYEIGSGPYTIDLATKFSGAGTYVVSPTNANMSLSGAILTITPTAALAQTTISVIGRNGGGDSPALTFNLTINAAAPAVTTPLPDQSLNTGAANVTVPLDSHFSGVATYAVSPTGQGATISGRNLVLSTAAARSLEITVTGTNSTGQSASDTFLFVVAQLQQAPSVQSAPTITGNTSVGSILTRTAGTATGIPTPTRATVWLRNGTILDGQTANSLDTTGFAADDVITTRDIWTNTGGTATGTSEAVTLAAENLQPLTYQVSPDPIAAGQPYSVTFNAVPDSTTGLTGTGLTRTGTAPASGNATFTAAKAGHVPVDASIATVPAVAPAASGGDIQWDGDTVTLVPPAATAGYPEPTRTLQTMTVAGVSRLADLDGEDLPGVQASASSQVVSASWLFSNGVSPNATVTRTYTIPAAAITATVEPTTARLYEGQTPAAIPGIATATDTANYSSTGGIILSAQLQVDGVDATTSTVLAPGNIVSVLTADDDGLTRRWVLSTVEYAFAITPEMGGAYRSVDINDLLPGAHPVSLTWDGVTTSISRNALEAAPVNHMAPAIAIEGETFSVTGNGLWWNSSTGGVPTYTYQWLRDGVAISGATGATYTRGGSDAGADTTVRVTATDANGSGQAVSNAIENPGAPAASVSYVSRSASSDFTNSRTFAGMDFGAEAATRDILVIAGQVGTGSATVTGVTVGGVTATRVQVSVGGTLQNGVLSPNTGLVYLSLWKARVPTGTSGDVVVTYSSNTASGFATVIRGENLASVIAFGTPINGPAITTTLSGGTAGRKAFGVTLATNGTAVSWTNGSEIFDEDALALGRWKSLAETTVAGDGTAAMTATRDSGSGSQTSMIVFSAGA